jgi:hypothetical protein
MKKIALPLCIVLLGLLAACSAPMNESNESSELNSQTDIACDDNTWLDNTIKALEASVDQKSEITRYRYNSETVYLVDNCLGCADAMQVLYSCMGEERCKFGGIAGFNTCPDFFETATDKKVIWHN